MVTGFIKENTRQGRERRRKHGGKTKKRQSHKMGGS